ncbi:hypothetical protein F441_09424, partial [Phytophthora nicotianae CJ01A1]
KYFTLPPQPDLVTQEYGSASFWKLTTNENREQVFTDLMEVLGGSGGPIFG